MEGKGEIIIYQTEDGKREMSVHLENETVWLSQNQMGSLFKKSNKTISEHISNVFKEKELERISTVRKFRTVQTEGGRKIERDIEFYNLDIIISVGYRVKSKQGTNFRIWATKILKEHILKGIASTKRSKSDNMLLEFMQIAELVHHSAEKKELSIDEAKGLLAIITKYTHSFVLLNKFDNNTLEKPSSPKKITSEINLYEATSAIEKLRKELIEKKEASDLFGRQKDESLQGILNSIVQTFDGEYLYTTIEEQAAHLLYFVIKSHPFTDGNKRIGAFLFIWFLQRNQHLFRENGEAKINDNALVALALLVAQSDPKNKELMIKLIINLVNQ